jgi:hypothetical protein
MFMSQRAWVPEDTQHVLPTAATLHPLNWKKRARFLPLHPASRLSLISVSSVVLPATHSSDFK